MREQLSFRIFRWVVLVPLTIFVLVPLYVMVTSAIKPLRDVQGDFQWWPQNITFQPFIQMWSTVPLARYFANSIIAVAVYSFMTAWGEILFASQLTNNLTRTLSVGLRAYATEAIVYWNQVMAAALVVSVPVVVGFLLLQRYLVAGLTAGAVK